MYYGLNIMSYIYYQAIKLLDNNKYITNFINFCKSAYNILIRFQCI
jgi:hypothetical protein